MAPSQTWPESQIVSDLAALRASVPLTHCITNIVVTGFTANVLLAAGASPAMVVAFEEVAEFARIASGLLINVGTVTEPEAKAMVRAASTAQEAKTPWVLDPVAVGALTFRTQVAMQLLDYKPSVIKGNASEIMALAGAAGGGKGVDSTADSGAALSLAQSLAKRTGTVVQVTGLVDYVTDGADVVSIPGGHFYLTKVTGTGCALGALTAAFLGAGLTPVRAAVASSAVFAAAAERAAAVSTGPGSFATAFIDQLFLLGIQ
ncbi:MAG: hydroxyethylthiazole kinase [Capsulimonadaceae bacterium]|nr:hydroxyethylthiazole kinase [Capsulimonadaceae bacterium]